MPDCPDCDGVGFIWPSTAMDGKLPRGNEPWPMHRCLMCDGTGFVVQPLPPPELTPAEDEVGDVGGWDYG